MARSPVAAPTGNSVATIKTSPNSLVAGSLADLLADNAGAGTEGVSLADIIMPRLSIIQTLSPQLKKNKPEFIEGAEVGMILNAATKALSRTANVIPCHYIRHHVEWKPNRGGYVKDHGPDEAIMKTSTRDDKHFDILPNGNIIMPTPTWYCLDVDNDLSQVVIPMSRTNGRPSKDWMSQATSEKLEHPTRGKFPAPLFYRSWTLTPFERSEGENDWFVWSVARGPSVIATDTEGALYLPTNAMAEAVRFRDLLMSGAIAADASTFAGDDMQGGEGSGGDSATKPKDSF